jgi:hypothetical protein
MRTTMLEKFTAAETTRREVIKKALFVVPVILTLPAVPAFASVGSGNQNDGPHGHGPHSDHVGR